MKKDKEMFKVSKEELKKTKGIKHTLQALKLATIDKKSFTLWLFFSIITLVLTMISAYVSKQALTIFQEGNINDLFYYAIAFLALDVIYYPCYWALEYFYDKFRKKFVISLKAKAYEQITSMKAQCFTNNNTASFTGRLSEADTISDAFTNFWNTIYMVIQSLAWCIMLATSVPLLFVVATAFYLLRLLVTKVVLPRYRVIRKRNRKVSDDAANLAIESIRGANDVKSLNFSETMKQECIEKQQESYDKNFKLNVWWRNRALPTNFFANGVNTFVMFLLIIWLFNNSSYSTASFLLFWMYRGHIRTFFTEIFNFTEKFSHVEVASMRVMELFDNEQYPVETFGDKEIKKFKGKIQFKNVHFEYEEKKPVLQGVSFDIDPNKITAIVGKTGCGKSTTLSLIARFYDPKKGRIIVDGVDSKKISKKCLRGNIAYVQQNPYIFNRTFRENLMLVKPEVTEEEMIDACKKSEIHDFILQTKDGYDTLIGENGITLSGGQRQRLAIARALLNNAKVIMFDESTSSLDNENQSKIQKTIENLSKDHTIVVVAHRLSTIINADKIIFMEGSKIKAEGTHQELFETCPEYQELYRIENTEEKDA